MPIAGQISPKGKVKPDLTNSKGITPSANGGTSVANSGTLTFSGSTSVTGSNTGDQTITLSGDISGSGSSGITTTLPTVNSNVGTFQGLTVNGKGQVTAATNQSYLTANQTITFSGDSTGSGTTAVTLTLATVNSNTGTFGTVNTVPIPTVNGKGLITAISTKVIFDIQSYSHCGGF